MYTILQGMRIIELSAFVAAPLAGLTLAQLGAEVVRVDPPGGGLDYNRWPLADNGESLYWSGLNMAKRSVTLDTKSEAGRTQLHELIAGSGPDGGIVLTNMPANQWFSYDALRAVRDDVILVSLSGHHDGAIAVDYTVNAGVGIPYMTGTDDDQPVNHVLPAWDAIAGMALATALLAAERHRRQTRKGQHVQLALSDIAYWLIANLGITADAELTGQDRPATGNHVYGAFGHDLPTADGRRVMVVALTKRQWSSLLSATNCHRKMAAIEAETGLDFTRDGDRYQARELILHALTAWARQHTFTEITTLFDAARLCWGPFRTVTEMLNEDPRAGMKNPLFQSVELPGIGTVRAPGSPFSFSAFERGKVKPPNQLGADTDAVFRDWLNITGRLDNG